MSGEPTIGGSPTSFAYDVAESGVATITLSRPDTLNSLTFDVYRELRDRFAAMQSEDAVKAVVITGQGRAFCSGGDVNAIIGELLRYDAPQLLAFTRMTGELIGNIRRLRKPVVAAVNGVAAGAGAVIALACDFRVLAERAKLAFLFVKVGLAGADMGASYLLPRLVGIGRATEILMLGEPILADECQRIGLAHRVVPLERVVDESRALAERLAKGPRFALGMTKVLLDQEQAMSLEQGLEAEAQAQQICMQTHDFREAHRAFVEKREARFEGR
jgi:enoyl-CoA hydratase/carnithine racemase